MISKAMRISVDPRFVVIFNAVLVPIFAASLIAGPFDSMPERLITVILLIATVAELTINVPKAVALWQSHADWAPLPGRS
jgi:uncharacterized protein YqhQ